MCRMKLPARRNWRPSGGLHDPTRRRGDVARRIGLRRVGEPFERAASRLRRAGEAIEHDSEAVRDRTSLTVWVYVANRSPGTPVKLRMPPRRRRGSPRRLVPSWR
jgi:hypothetical protein